MDCAAGADVGGDGCEIDVCEPVAGGFAAAEGGHDFLVGGVDGYEAGYVCDEGTVMVQWSVSGYDGGVGSHFWNSINVDVVAAWTRGQFPAAQETSFPGELLFVTQYAAAEYWPHRFKSLSRPVETSGLGHY